jgi:hypothetical protein
MTENTPAPAPAPAPQEQPAPLMYYLGQPIDRQTAESTRNGLLADSKFCEAARNGDVAKQRQLADLYMIARGVQPQAAAPMASADDVEIQVLDRAAREQAVHVESLKSMADFTPEQIHQITNGRPIPAEEKRIAERRLAALQRDKGFVDRYLAGDQEARLQMSLAAIAARGLPVARNLEEIKAWEAAHPLRK